MSTTVTATKNKSSHGNQKLMNRSENSERTHQVMFAPRFDVWEGDDELILYGDMPGVDPTDLNIQFENRQLTINGKARRCCGGVEHLYSEYEIGDFHRTFAIGEAINSEGIRAEMRDGVLMLHLPKSEMAKPRRIEVNAS